ncbi:transposase [Streptomyces sp. NPDC060027]|uniref:transposase n=1 Tax=Streptomyces sp. NPDC060027 TaxID=3347040 RepID=UPI0036CE8F84
MIRAYKFLLRPTVRQDQALREMPRDHCSLYNGALQERRDAYRHDPPDPLPATASMAGIDLGIANFLADSDGAFVPNPRHGRRAAAKQQMAQQALS